MNRLVGLFEPFNFPKLQVVEMIERGERLSRPNNCPENVYAKMLQCWQYEPMDRPAFKTLFSFFKSMMVYTNVKWF